MQTLRQAIADLRGTSKFLSSDIMISDRLLASLLRGAVNTIVTQSLDKRKLWQSPNLFTPILCLKMEKVNLSECCDYMGEAQVARSIKALPLIGEGTWGLAIQLVSGLDGMKAFKESTPRRYANIVKLKLRTGDVFYWMQNNHLYVSNPDTELVNAFPFFAEDVPNDLLFPGEDCNCSDKPDIIDLCTNPLDKPFKYPANRMTDIQNIVLDKLSKTFNRTIEQKTSDNQEGN